MLGRTMSLNTKKVYFLLVSILIETETARILGIFPTPSISHQVVFRPLMHELAHRGHEVTVITPDPVFLKGEGPKNLIEINVHDISYNNWRKVLMYHTGKKEDIGIQIKTLAETLSLVFNLQMEDSEVKRVLGKEKRYYDLIFVEACNGVALGVANIFDAPIILFSSFGVFSEQYSILGASSHLYLYPTPIAQRLYDLTLWEKVYQLYQYLSLTYIISIVEHSDYQLMQKHFGEDVPRYYDLIGKRVSMIFVNEHPFWDNNRPVPPNIVFLGGIHKSLKKDLPEDLKLFLDSSKSGVIYVSFGTNVDLSLLPNKKIDTIIKVLSQLPYNVLLKWDSKELPGIPKNIKKFKWVPQSDVLAHPNVKLFITQGGIQSTEEAINAGVPVIGMPMLFDQWYNVEQYAHHKIGMHLSFDTFTELDLSNAIDSVINNSSYKQNILRLRSLMRDKPIKPLDAAVWWSEHVIKYGTEHLKSPATNMSLIEYYEVELVLIVLGIITTVFILLSLILKAVIGFVYKRITTKNKKQKIN